MKLKIRKLVKLLLSLKNSKTQKEFDLRAFELAEFVDKCGFGLLQVILDLADEKDEMK